MAAVEGREWFPWLLAAVLLLAIIGLIGYARGEPGDDGRVPDIVYINVEN